MNPSLFLLSVFLLFFLTVYSVEKITEKDPENFDIYSISENHERGEFGSSIDYFIINYVDNGEIKSIEMQQSESLYSGMKIYQNDVSKVVIQKNHIKELYLNKVDYNYIFN